MSEAPEKRQFDIHHISPPLRVLLWPSQAIQLLWCWKSLSFDSCARSAVTAVWREGCVCLAVCCQTVCSGCGHFGVYANMVFVCVWLQRLNLQRVCDNGKAYLIHAAPWGPRTQLRGLYWQERKGWILFHAGDCIRSTAGISGKTKVVLYTKIAAVVDLLKVCLAEKSAW